MSVISNPKAYGMSNDEVEIIGKPVKDMYGSSMGKVIGTTTDIDSSIQTVGVDCGSGGLCQIPYEQLVVQGGVVIFIPKWRLDSQRLLREKSLTLRRLRALMDIVSNNDEMKDDAEIIHEKYRSRLVALTATKKEIQGELESRLSELDEQMKSVKLLIFDARVQYKSDEIPETAFDSVKRETTDLVERITHETAEISNVQRRIADLETEVQQILEPPQQHLQDSAVSYLNNTADIEAKLPEAPTQEPAGTATEHDGAQTSETPQQASPVTAATDTQTDWLARMEAQ